MDHLDVVASAFIANPVAARLTVALGGDALEDILDQRPGGLVASRHQARPIPSSLLATGHTGPDKADALLGEVLCPTVRVGVVRIAAINDDVVLVAEGQECLDEVVDGLSGHDQKHHPPRLLEQLDKLLDRVGTDDGLAFGLVLEKEVDLFHGPIEGYDFEAMVGSIEDEVLAHDGQTDEAKISTSDEARRLADIDAGKTSAIVSEDLYQPPSPPS